MLGIACYRLGKIVLTAQELPIDQINQHKKGIKFEQDDHWNNRICAVLNNMIQSNVLLGKQE